MSSRSAGASAVLSDPSGTLPDMDAASLLTGLLLGALLATAATLGLVALFGRRRPAESGLEPVHESLDHLHRLLAGMERARATAHGELREQMGSVGPDLRAAEARDGRPRHRPADAARPRPLG